MKNSLGIMIVFAAAGCQMVDSPSQTEEGTESQESGTGGICSGEPMSCNMTYTPPAKPYTGSEYTTPNTVVLVDSTRSPNQIWLYGADTQKGVMWIAYAPLTATGSILNRLIKLPGGYINYRPPICGGPNCPEGDGSIYMTNLARAKFELYGLADTATQACHPPKL